MFYPKSMTRNYLRQFITNTKNITIEFTN